MEQRMATDGLGPGPIVSTISIHLATQNDLSLQDLG